MASMFGTVLDITIMMHTLDIDAQSGITQLARHAVKSVLPKDWRTVKQYYFGLLLLDIAIQHLQLSPSPVPVRHAPENRFHERPERSLRQPLKVRDCVKSWRDGRLGPESGAPAHLLRVPRLHIRDRPPADKISAHAGKLAKVHV